MLSRIEETLQEEAGVEKLGGAYDYFLIIYTMTSRDHVRHIDVHVLLLHVFALLSSGRRSIWSTGGRCNVEATVCSPSQTVEFDILVVDQSGSVQSSQCEAIDPGIWTLTYSVETPLPDVLVAVDRQTKCVDLRDWWGGGCVGDIGCAAIFDLSAKLKGILVRY